MTTPDGDSSNLALTTTTPNILRKVGHRWDDQWIVSPVNSYKSTKVLKCKQERLYVHLDSVNNLTINALVDSRAYVIAIAQKELDTVNQKAPNNISEIDDLPIFKYK